MDQTMLQPMFQGLFIRSNREDGISWDAKGPIKRQTYAFSLHDSAYPAQGSKQQRTPLAADELRLEAPFSEDGLQGTETFILKSPRLGELAEQLTSKAMRTDNALQEALPESDFFTRTVKDEANVEVPEEVGSAKAANLPQSVREILQGDDVELVDAYRTLDRNRSQTISNAPEGELTQPLTTRHRRQRWAEHRERLLQALEKATRPQFQQTYHTVETLKRTLLIFSSRDSKVQTSNSTHWQGDANAFQGIYAGRQ